MDWKDSLQSLKEMLPEGDDTAATAEPAAETGTDTPAKQPRLDIILDRKGRKGKEATIIAGFTMDDADVAALAATLKQKLGTGGSARGGEILIQGDKRQRVLELLAGLGYKARII